MTTITCEHCESEIDVAKDKNCVIYDPSGITAVMCEACRDRAWTARQRARTEQLCDRIKRGWRA